MKCEHREKHNKSTIVNETKGLSTVIIINSSGVAKNRNSEISHFLIGEIDQMGTNEYIFSFTPNTIQVYLEFWSLVSLIQRKSFVYPFAHQRNQHSFMKVKGSRDGHLLRSCRKFLRRSRKAHTNRHTHSSYSYKGLCVRACLGHSIEYTFFFERQPVPMSCQQ